MSSQTNTRHGDLTFPSNEDLSGKEGRLVKLVNSSGVAKVALPDDVADRCLYVLIDGGDASGDEVTVRPLEPARNIRVPLSGTCSPGDRMTLATIDGSLDGSGRQRTGRRGEPGRQTERGAPRRGRDGPGLQARPRGGPFSRRRLPCGRPSRRRSSRPTGR